MLSSVFCLLLQEEISHAEMLARLCSRVEEFEWGGEGHGREALIAGAWGSPEGLAWLERLESNNNITLVASMTLRTATLLHSNSQQ